MRLVNVARSSYNLFMTSTGIRELKDNLSHYVRRTEAGERIAVTAHGRVVAELGPPTGAAGARGARYEDLIAAGVARPALEPGDPLADWPDLRLPKGTAAHLIDSDRGEA
jgi:antitoxin (DNA-binding transcriptional repressor) of toxin-antitoxin stability system